LVDLRTDAELAWLAGLVRAVDLAASGAPWFVAGAMARDLLLSHAHGIRIARLTRDVDIAIAVESWEAFDTIRAALIRTGRFAPLGVVHKFQYEGGISLDLIPFGGLESGDRTIAWPPDRAVVMNVAGFREALAASLVVLLPEETRLHVVSLPALVTLKLTAWPERRLTEPGKDAQDFFLVLSRYLDAGQADRLYGEAAHLLDEPDFDYARAGARLLGADVRRFLEAAGSHATIADLGRLLVSETDPNQPLRLVQDARPAEVDEALALLQAFRRAFEAGSP
jgi:predicted nucleotidyltransferase